MLPSLLNNSLYLPLFLQDTFVEYPSSTNITVVVHSNNHSIQQFIIRCLSIYALILVIIGTVGNSLTIVILCRRNLRRYVTMRYLIAVSISDIISLYGWNLNNFYKFTISKDYDNLEELSLLHCRIISYFSFVGLQLSSWCLTAVSLDRCLSLYFLTWKQKYGQLSRTKYHLVILTLICLLLNSHILFLNGYRTGPSNTIVKCYKTRTNPYYIFPRWERVHLVVYNLCPFIIMLSCNIYIISITIRSARIRTTTRSIRRTKTLNRHRQLSLMLMIVTFAFVFLTLPSCLYYVFVRHRMPTDDSFRQYRYMVQICLGSVQFTSHAINFFLYCFSATNFRNELKDFFHEIYRFNLFHSDIQFRTTIRKTMKKNAHSRSTLEYQQTYPMNNTSKDLQMKSVQDRLNNEQSLSE